MDENKTSPSTVGNMAPVDTGNGKIAEHIHNDVNQSDVPPPLPKVITDDKIAWALTAIPILGVLFEKAITPSAPQSHFIISFLLILIVNSVLCIVDAKNLKKIDGLAEKENILKYFLLVPLYLWRRGVLLGKGNNWLFVWIASFLVSIIGGNYQLMNDNLYAGAGAPPCDSKNARIKVTEAFPTIPLMKMSSLTAIDFKNIKETLSSQENEIFVKTCSATVITSSGKDVNVIYRITRKDEKITYYVQVAP